MYIRREYLDKLIAYRDTEFIKVISGVRRSGKSFLLKMFEDYLLDEGLEDQILSINFEHPDTFGIQTSEKLYNYIKERVTSDKKQYFLFDEIQEVENWQSLINGLRVAYNCDIYITGSNASLLSGEMATYLSGRYVEIQVYPLSFSEIVKAKKLQSSIEIEREFDHYLQYGGFPSLLAIDNEDLKKDVLKGIYNSILLRDVSQRGNIANTDLLLKLSAFLMDNIGSPISVNKITNYFNSSGTKVSYETIDRYLALLEDAFIFYKAIRYDIRGKERLKTLGKYYLVDLGLRDCILGRPNTNRGAVVENLVFLKLLQSGYRVFVGKYDEKEIDFVAFKDAEVKYIQVAFEIPSLSDRETRNLLLIRENYEKILITMNYRDVGVVDGIKIIHLIDFLLEDF